MTRPYRPEGMPSIIPYLTCKSGEEAIDFYQRAFGFHLKNYFPNPEGKIMHAEMDWKDGLIMLGVEGSGGDPMKTPEHSGVESPIVPYVYCEDVDALFAQAVEAGAKVKQGPVDMFWGDRICSLFDPDGYCWTFATNVGDFDPSKAPKE